MILYRLKHQRIGIDKMKYQLVTQFPETLLSYEEFIKLEELLREQLHDDADLDGHDIGSGEMNIFILTNEPELIFKRIKNLLPDRIVKEARIAYREVTKDEYHVLWPPFLSDFNIA
jgi:hypothetical protein